MSSPIHIPLFIYIWLVVANFYYKTILQTVQGLNPDEYMMLNSIPGIGKDYSADILAEFGSVKVFQSADSLAKYCGIVWNDNNSGDFDAEDKHMSKVGNRYLRYYIIEATGSKFIILLR